jgi:hypothetical protein
MEAETWYDAEEAVKAGLADRVSEEAAPTNHFNLTQFRNVPERLRDQMPADDAPQLEIEAEPAQPVTVQEPTGATTQDRLADPLLARLRIELAEASIA